jgi:hypothetical protein
MRLPRSLKPKYAVAAAAATGALALLSAGCFASPDRSWFDPAAVPVAPAAYPEVHPDSVVETAASPIMTGALADAGIAFSLREAPLSRLPGEVDSNSPVFWDGDRMVLFNSAEQPVRSSGSSLDALADPVDVTCVGCERPGGLWLEAVWKDPASGVLYGWYHLEPSDLACQTAPIIGAAISKDGGLTWQDRGPVLESRYPIDCSYENGFFVGGNGDFHVLPDQEHGYFYFLFSNYAGPIEEQGIGIARSAFGDRGQPGTVFKYFGEAWDEPGLGGRVTPLFPSATGWQGPHIKAFWGPSVHWNEHLQTYVALLNHTDGMYWVQEGVYLAVSPDLLTWSEPQKILDTEAWYPQVIGTGPEGTDTRAGKAVRIFVGGISTLTLEFA